MDFTKDVLLGWQSAYVLLLQASGSRLALGNSCGHCQVGSCFALFCFLPNSFESLSRCLGFLSLLFNHFDEQLVRGTAFVFYYYCYCYCYYFETNSKAGWELTVEPRFTLDLWQSSCLSFQGLGLQV